MEKKEFDSRYLTLFFFVSSMQCLNKKQKNHLTTWTIMAVVANDLFTDDSFVVRIFLLVIFMIEVVGVVLNSLYLS